MSKRYRILLGTVVIVAIGAVGGIAAAEQGGNSADHRQNPTTTSGPAADTTTTTFLAPDAEPKIADDQADASDQSNRTEALCWALHQGSEQGQAMKLEHSHVFANLDCTGVEGRPGGDTQADTESDDVADTSDQGQGGPPESPGQSGDHGPATPNPNAQGHGKP